MMAIKTYVKYKIIQLHKRGYGKKRISASISEEWGLKIPLSTIRNIVSKYKKTGEIIKDLPKPQKKSKFGDEEEHIIFIEKDMKETRDISSSVLSRRIKEKFNISYSASRV